MCNKFIEYTIEYIYNGSFLLGRRSSKRLVLGVRVDCGKVGNGTKITMKESVLVISSCYFCGLFRVKLILLTMGLILTEHETEVLPLNQKRGGDVLLDMRQVILVIIYWRITWGKIIQLIVEVTNVELDM